jgi:hypothetical protein
MRMNLIPKQKSLSRDLLRLSVLAEWTAANLLCHGVPKIFFPEVSPMKNHLLLRQVMSRRNIQVQHFGYVYWYAQDCKGTLCC